jgi:hypothetical protein
MKYNNDQHLIGFSIEKKVFGKKPQKHSNEIWNKGTTHKKLSNGVFSIATEYTN